MSAPYAGFYINLDRCPDRRAEMESEFARCGLGDRYQRFAAIDGNALGWPSGRLNNGELGCFTSHTMVLKNNINSTQHLHVIEDDTLFASGTALAIQRVMEAGELDALDLLFTDVALPLSNDIYRSYKALYDRIVTRSKSGALEGAAFQILGVDKLPFTAMSSYIVNKGSIGKLCALYENELKRGADAPVDVFVRQLAQSGAIKAGCLFPFVTSVRIEHTLTSSVRRVQDKSMRFTAANIARYSFFIGCDWKKCRELLERFIPLPPPSDMHAEILAHIMAFSLLEKGAAEAEENPPLTGTA